MNGIFDKLWTWLAKVDIKVATAVENTTQPELCKNVVKRIRTVHHISSKLIEEY